ncbi:MAG: Fpg/Nei family DNA glycosylase [Firmicutes bacterium]|nr:Fpg/Nei family DNA glycosylase [Bacillota bacterium]
MPELPEIHNLARQMDEELRGRTVGAIEIRQVKCLNVPVPEFESLVLGKTLGRSASKGKWVFTDLEPGVTFLLNLGMGGNVVYHKSPETLPAKYNARVYFSDGSALSIGFWWFGYIHAVKAGDISSHKMTARLGMDPLSESFTFQAFNALLEGKRGAIKTVLLDQECIAGIGNVYAQDILFKARLHPNRRIPDIGESERRLLHRAIVANLKGAAALGGLAYEKDLYDRPGGFKEFLVGYKEGQPCPTCGSTILKVKTGATASYVCPSCQK